MSSPQDPNVQQPAHAPQYAQEPQQAPQYAAPQHSGQYAPAPASSTNTMSIISMISSIIGLFTWGILCVLGVILGHISLSQIKRSGEGGKGMALTGLIVGYIGIAGWIIAAILLIVVLGVFSAAATSAGY